MLLFSVSLSLTNVFLLILSLSLSLSLSLPTTTPPRRCVVRMLPFLSLSLFVVQVHYTTLLLQNCSFISLLIFSLPPPYLSRLRALERILSLSLSPPSQPLFCFLYLLLFPPPIPLISLPCLFLLARAKPKNKKFSAVSAATTKVTRIRGGTLSADETLTINQTNKLSYTLKNRCRLG